MSKMEKLVEVLETAANAVTPSNGGTKSPGEDYYFDAHVTLVDIAYRIGRALTLARSIAREQD